MFITRETQKYSVECLKFAKLHTSVRIYLFRNKFPLTDREFIVAVRKDDVTLYFQYFAKIEKAVASYLNQLVINA